MNHPAKNIADDVSQHFFGREKLQTPAHHKAIQRPIAVIQPCL